MKRTTLLSIVAGLLLLAAGYRYLQILGYPMGGGKYKESPDKRFVANASSMTDRKFWGGKRHFYSFTIDDTERRSLRQIVIDEPPEGMIDWYGDPAAMIEWSADNSAATFRFRGTQLVLQVRP